MLVADLAGLGQGDGKGLAQGLVVLGLAGDVTDQAPQAAAQELDLLVHALELFGMGVAPGHHRRPLGHADIGLAQRHAMGLGQLAELPDRGFQELGVGREGDVLGLHRGVDADPGQIALLQGPGLVGDAQGLGQERVEPLADALAPVAQAGALVAQFVLEELLAGEVLEIGVGAYAQGYAPQRSQSCSSESP